MSLPLRDSVLQRKVTLAEMLDINAFSEVVKSFVELYGIGIKVFDERGNKLADVKTGNGDFCGYVFSFTDGRSRCMATVARVKDGPIAATQGARLPVIQDSTPVPKGLVAMPCFTGLRYLMMPVMWEGDPIGRIVFGPFTPDDLKDFPKSLTDVSPELDLSKLKLHLGKIRKAPESTVAKVMMHFSQLFDTLVAGGHKIFLTSQVHIEATLETNRDLEERNKKLEDAMQKLKELDRLKSAFLATVSHELRTPLTSIIGYSEMLAEGLAGPMNPEQVEYVKTIMEKGETLLRLITSILDISQIEAGKVKLSFAPFDMGEVCTQSMTSLKPQATKKGLNLSARLPKVQSQVLGDKDRLRQVITNLMTNAVKFTPKGGSVTVSLSEVGPQPELGDQLGYRVVVEDTGVGIPKDQFDKIFQSFYQVDSSSTREFGGAGIGLAIVKSFVDGHGGQIRVASDIGKGSKFTLILPSEPARVQVQIAAPVQPVEATEDRF